MKKVCGLDVHKDTIFLCILKARREKDQRVPIYYIPVLIPGQSSGTGFCPKGRGRNNLSVS